jgi:hypothetical protein
MNSNNTRIKHRKKNELNVSLKKIFRNAIVQVCTLKSRINGSLSAIKPYFLCNESGGCGGGGRGNARMTLIVS